MGYTVLGSQRKTRCVFRRGKRERLTQQPNRDVAEVQRGEQDLGAGTRVLSSLFIHFVH